MAIICQSCGKTLNDSVKFCSYCGKPVHVNDAVSFCSECGNKLETGIRFCSNCGYDTYLDKMDHCSKEEYSGESKRDCSYENAVPNHHDGSEEQRAVFSFSRMKENAESILANVRKGSISLGKSFFEMASGIICKISAKTGIAPKAAKWLCISIATLVIIGTVLAGILSAGTRYKDKLIKYGCTEEVAEIICSIDNKTAKNDFLDAIRIATEIDKYGSKGDLRKVQSLLAELDKYSSRYSIDRNEQYTNIRNRLLNSTSENPDTSALDYFGKPIFKWYASQQILLPAFVEENQNDKPLSSDPNEILTAIRAEGYTVQSKIDASEDSEWLYEYYSRIECIREWAVDDKDTYSVRVDRQSNVIAITFNLATRPFDAQMYGDAEIADLYMEELLDGIDIDNNAVLYELFAADQKNELEAFVYSLDVVDLRSICKDYVEKENADRFPYMFSASLGDNKLSFAFYPDRAFVTVAPLHSAYEEACMLLSSPESFMHDSKDNSDRVEHRTLSIEKYVAENGLVINNADSNSNNQGNSVNYDELHLALGNSCENIDNGGIAVSDARYYYYTNCAEDSFSGYEAPYYIFRESKDNGNMEEVLSSEYPIQNLCVYDHWLYYLGNTDELQDGYRIYRVKSDGSERQQEISNRAVLRFVTAGDHIFYISQEDQNAVLCRMNANGTDNRMLYAANRLGSDIYVSNGWVYFCIDDSADDENGIYRISYDGAIKEQVVEPADGIVKTFDLLSIYKDALYFCEYSFGDDIEDGLVSAKVCCCNLDGGDEHTVMYGSKDFMNYCADRLFYGSVGNSADESIMIYKSDNWFNSPQSFVNGWSVNIVGDRMYYRGDYLTNYKINHLSLTLKEMRFDLYETITLSGKVVCNGESDVWADYCIVLPQTVNVFIKDSSYSFEETIELFEQVDRLYCYPNHEYDATEWEQYVGHSITLSAMLTNYRGGGYLYVEKPIIEP